MGYRKLPYGYKMEMGETRIHEEEAGYVKQIFQDYLAGTSFKAIASWLTEHSVPFDGTKPWNKNMVARLLEDERYTGKKGFPAIIQIDVLNAARERRQSQAKTKIPTAGERVARQLSDVQLSDQAKRQLLALLNWVVRNPEEIKLPRHWNKYGETPNRDELDEVLRQLPVDEERAKSLITQGAVAAYKNIPTREYEARRLRHLFEQAKPEQALDADLLRTAISKVTVENGHLASITLKSGQVIEYQPGR